MKKHEDWSSPGFLLPLVAPAIGPFGRSPFLSTLWNAMPRQGRELFLAESDQALVPFTVGNNVLEFVGHRDLVDYRSPLGLGGADLIMEAVEALPAGFRLVLDSLPAEAAKPVASGLAAAGIDAQPVVHAEAAVLHLPDSFDEYLVSIGKKERHELRRKRRRYEAEHGLIEVTDLTSDRDVFQQFVELHRRAEGAKGSFMTDRMEEYFGALIDLPGWAITALLSDSGDVAAAAFGFVDDDGYFLYNSAFDPDLRHLSPGQVLLGAMIERAINEGRRVFDFLKGDESYKFKLGATSRPLYEIVAIR